MESSDQHLQFEFFNEIQPPDLSFTPTKDPKKTLQCPFPDCGKFFRYKSEIDRHLTIHYNTRSHVCTHPGCDKSFKRPDALKVHMQSHNEKPQFFCHFKGCSAGFKDSPALKYHINRYHLLPKIEYDSKNQSPIHTKIEANQSQENRNLKEKQEDIDSFFVDLSKEGNKNLKSRENSWIFFQEDWGPQPTKNLCTEEKKEKSSSSFAEDVSEFGNWLKETEKEFVAEQKNCSKNHLEDFDVVSLWKKLKQENQELKRQLAEKMTLFSQNLQDSLYL